MTAAGNRIFDPNHEWVEAGPDGLPTPEAFAAWPDCHWPDGCANKSCGPLGSSYCFPHTILIRGISAEEGRRQIKARREQAFGAGCDDEEPLKPAMVMYHAQVDLALKGIR
jgi:hypothetical protein